MILFMDLGMYVFHRIAHHPRLYALFHRFHHRHETTNPISLFVLHPAEVIGFGVLMILFLMAYPMTVGGLLAYLTINVVFGTLGHSGVEPLPRGLQTVPLLRLIGTSTFHAEHHEHRQFNFGFYTLIWDKLFGTLDPEVRSPVRGQEMRIRGKQNALAGVLPGGRLKNRQECLSHAWLEMDRVAFRGERRLVDDLAHRRVGVDGGVDFLAGELLVEGEAHLGDELGGVLTDDVRA